jgi:hypothetical protein
MPHFSGAAGPRDPSPDEPGAQRFHCGGHTWTAVRRHEMMRLARGVSAERRLTLFFFGAGDDVRRAVVPSDLPDPAPDDVLCAFLAGASPVRAR